MYYICDTNNEYMNNALHESLTTINEILAQHNKAPLTEGEAMDWGIVGGESYADLLQIARDLVSESHTDRCANKDAWRYEV